MFYDSSFVDEDSYLNLYTNISKEAMIRLGFVPADLEPLSPENIEIPPKF